MSKFGLDSTADESAFYWAVPECYLPIQINLSPAARLRDPAYL